MFNGIPIIGLSGGIGSGKSFVAAMLGELGCIVIDSDELVRSAYESPEIVAALRQQWGDVVVKPGGSVDRRAIADIVFNRPSERQRLEALLHPVVAASRVQRMEAALGRGERPPAFVWDSPLLFETGLSRDCDAVIFVDAPTDVRTARVAEKRGWTAAELARRENSQMGLDIKRQMSNYSVVNTADEKHVRDQVRQLLPRIIETMKAASARSASADQDSISQP